jgi:WD40 repeat protein
MAVNGDSGTGKTYFCEAIKDGFGDIGPEEILYMMRDRKKDQAIFNRILGREWLEKYIDPVYYQGYPVSQEDDDPEGYFSHFLEEQADQKLIILDGCRDRHYFQRIVERFYRKGLLDVVVNFRAAHSTRRENLEEREVALESIKTHLSFLEEPALEDTLFYQEGNTLIYDLDNSSPHRLAREEIQELFQKSHIDHWGDLILLGDFSRDALSCRLDSGRSNWERERFDHVSEAIPGAAAWEFSMEERKFQFVLNRDLGSQPCFLGHIPLSDVKPKQIRLYAQDQIAGLGETGLAFVLTFVDNRIFYARIGSSRGLSLLGREMFTIDEQGRLLRLSFESRQAALFTSSFPPVTCLDTRLKDRVATGHSDGSLRVWDFTRMRILRIAAHDTPVKDLTLDDWGRAYTTGSDGLLKGWDLRRNTRLTVSGLGCTRRTRRYPGGKILVESDALHILDPENESFLAVSVPMDTEISDISVYPDGRFVAAMSDGIGVFAPDEDLCKLSLIKAHAHSTLGCLTLGPKILTCGRETDEQNDLRISGTDLFVKHESEKLSLQA